MKKKQQVWKHPLVDWDTVASNLSGFLNVLITVSKDPIGGWDHSNYQRALEWADYFEKLIEGRAHRFLFSPSLILNHAAEIPEDEFEQHTVLLDEEIERLTSNRFEITEALRSMNSKMLSCAKHFILRLLLNNPFITQSLLKLIARDYLALADDGDEEDRKIATEKLVKVSVETPNMCIS